MPRLRKPDCGAVAILQARMSSTRLPGKVMMPILGRPMMLRQIERLRRSETISSLVVATSDEGSDDVICDMCDQHGIAFFRGSLTDVLDRYHRAAQSFPWARQIVRLTADCPLADWRVIDDCIRLQVESGADYTSNTIPRTFPMGLEVEVFTRPALERAWREAKSDYEREHVTAYFYRNPETFRLKGLTDAEDRSSQRWTVDTAQDLELVRYVYEALYPTNAAFTTEAIHELLSAGGGRV